MKGQNYIDRLLRIDEVLHVTGLSKNTIYRRMREGTFPRQIRIGPNSVAWRQSDIERWISSLHVGGPPAL